jgi:hypothetical protein
MLFTVYQPYPGGPIDGSMKGMVNSGGSWSMDADAFSASHPRNADSVDDERPDLGFRCALVLELARNRTIEFGCDALEL